MTEVYRLPPEPPVGTVVEVMGGRYEGDRWERCRTEDELAFWRGPGSWTTWERVLRRAGPDGVRVVEEQR
jgi:hypothetical protein